MSKLPKLSRTRKGYIGENLVIKFLLEKNLKLYAPIVDDFGIDLLIEQDNKYTKVQVKYHTTIMSSSAIQVKIQPTKADYIAIPVQAYGRMHIMWYKNTRKNKRYTIAFQKYYPKNNQVKKVNFFKSFLECPFDKK
tara:strand:- start:17380 stop:17787 length:408 start_codon:yes stop_codon:yes gene_type:complete